MWMLLLASVYLNGVNIDGLRGQKFEKCKAVRIDDRGDVYLECPGYQVEQPAASAATAPGPLIPSAVAAAMAKRYWLVSEEKDSASAQYDVDGFVNARVIRQIKT